MSLNLIDHNPTQTSQESDSARAKRGMWKVILIWLAVSLVTMLLFAVTMVWLFWYLDSLIGRQ